MVVGIQFIHVESVRFPILMQTQAEIEARLALQPGDVGRGLASFRGAVLAVEIQALAIFPAVHLEARRIQAWAEPEVQTCRPGILPQELERRQRSGWLLAVDAGGNVKAWGMLRVACCVGCEACCGTGEAED